MRREIDELRGQLKLREGKSITSTDARRSLEEDTIYFVKDVNRINLDLVVKNDGRLHTWPSRTDGAIGSSGGIAPADAQYVVSSTDAELPNADVLTGTTNQITVTNGTNLATLSAPDLARLIRGLPTSRGTRIFNEIDARRYAMILS